MSLEVIEEIHSLKTAALIRASACIGVIAASGTQQQYDAAVEYANAVGLAFQIRDDLLDMTSTSEEMGKTIGKDAENGKITFASVYGEKRCEEFIDIETEKAKKAVKSVFSEPCFLMGLADMLAKRRY